MMLNWMLIRGQRGPERSEFRVEVADRRSRSTADGSTRQLQPRTSDVPTIIILGVGGGEQNNTRSLSLRNSLVHRH